MRKIVLMLTILMLTITCGESKKRAIIPIPSSVEEAISSGNSQSIVVAPVNAPAAGAGLDGTQATTTVTVKTDETFTYETTKTITITGVVTDSNGTPIPAASVLITGDPNSNVLFQQVTGEEGTINGAIKVNAAEDSVDVTVTVCGVTTQPIAIPLLYPVTKNGVTTTAQLTTINGIQIPITAPSCNGTTVADRDHDGVEDSKDFYPDDPTKTTVVRFPSEGVNTIAFEDLYPNAGDADLNDYVIQFYNEEDLNAKGEVVEVRGAYQHVARGAGYRHTLNLLLPVTANISYQSIITDSSGVDQKTGLKEYKPTAAEISAGLPILGNSGKTITSPNSSKSDVYSPGHLARVKIRFETPITRAALGTSPYNIYLRVLDTSKNIFFPGKYFDSKGKDLYMDSKNFPWAILVPGVWAWPLERKDIRNADSTGYPKFNDWVASKGLTSRDWYLTVKEENIYKIPGTPSNLMATINSGNSDYKEVIAIMLAVLGLLAGYVLRKKFVAN